MLFRTVFSRKAVFPLFVLRRTKLRAFRPAGVAAPDWLALTEALALAIKSSISRTVSVGNGVPAFRAPRAVECKAQSASRHGVANVVWLSSTLPIQSSPSKSNRRGETH